MIIQHIDCAIFHIYSVHRHSTKQNQGKAAIYRESHIA